MTNFEKLSAEILAYSVEKKNFSVACAEWELVYVYHQPGGECICSHYPITEHCCVRNKLNHKSLIVGNECIKHFNKNTENIKSVPRNVFNSLRNMRRDVDKTAGKELLELCQRLGIFKNYDVENYKRRLYGRTAPKRDLNDQDKKYRKEQNGIILLGFDVQRPSCRCLGFPPAIPRLNKAKGTYFYGCRNFGSGGCGFTKGAVVPRDDVSDDDDSDDDDEDSDDEDENSDDDDEYSDDDNE